MTASSVRLALYYTLMMTVTVGALLFGMRLLLEREMLRVIDWQAKSKFQEVLRRAGEDYYELSSEELVGRLSAYLEADNALYYYVMRDAAGGEVYRSSNLGGSTLPVTAETAAGVSAKVGWKTELRFVKYALGDQYIYIGLSLATLDRLLEGYLYGSVLVLLVLLGINLLMGFVLSRIALRPIQAMQETASRINARNLEERIPVPPGRDEISELARLLNDMFNRLERSFSQIRRFTEEASHELRTPLSIISLQAQRLIGRGGLSGRQESELQDMLEEIAGLTSLVNNMLLLAKADGQETLLTLEEFDCRAFIDSFSEDAAALVEEAGQNFALLQNDPGVAQADARWLRQVLLNLLSNAVKFNTPGGRVALRSRVQGTNWIIGVEDRGPGVREDELTRIFERRFRAAHSRDAEVEGRGLGLAISRAIVSQHGGMIWASNLSGGGLLVEMSLPVLAGDSRPSQRARLEELDR